MKTKIIRSIEEVVIEKAKTCSQRLGKSLSDLVQSYLEELAFSEEIPENVPEASSDLFGSVNFSDKMASKAAIRFFLYQKHNNAN